MEVSEFRIDLGRGDYLDITLEGKEKVTLMDLLSQVEKAKAWVIFNKTAFHVSHIKRIEQIS